jgi:hypothetical protein
VVITAHQVRSYVPLVTSEERTPEETPAYEICVAGRLAERWSPWFDGLTVTGRADGTTVLHGPVIDQAALHGVLQKLRDLGIPLVALRRLPTTPAHPNDKEN